MQRLQKLKFYAFPKLVNVFLFCIVYLNVNFGQNLKISPPVLPPSKVTLHNVFEFSVLDLPTNSSPFVMAIDIRYGGSNGNLELASSSQFEIKEFLANGEVSELIIQDGVSHLKFFNTEFQNFIIMNGYLPAGKYEFMYKIYQKGEIVGQEKVAYEGFIDENQLKLVSPFNESISEPACPFFTWIYDDILSSSQSFRLSMVEVSAGQSPYEAFSSNPILFRQEDLKVPFYQCDAAFVQLYGCKNYAWMVELVDGKKAVQISELWVFKVFCEEEESKKSKLAYRYLSDEPLLPFTEIGGDTLGIIMDMPYEIPSEMGFTITNLTDSGKPISFGLTDLASQNSTKDFNQNRFYQIPFESAGLVADHVYLLEASNQKRSFYLKFYIPKPE
jgi:hypothetical protein